MYTISKKSHFDLLPRRAKHTQPLVLHYLKGGKVRFLLPLSVDQTIKTLIHQVSINITMPTPTAGSVNGNTTTQVSNITMPTPTAGSVNGNTTTQVSINITMPTPNAGSVNGNTTTQVSWSRRFWLFICLVSFLCAFGIFTESQFYAYTIRIHGTYAHIIYFVVGVTLSSGIHVVLIQPDRCKAFLENYKGCFILKSCGGYLVMFTMCFLSSGTGLQYLGLSSDGTAPSPAVAVASYRLQDFSEIAGLLASALLTVNALSIIMLLRPTELNTIFDVAATLTLESAMALLYNCPHVTVAAAVFIMAMTLLKNFLCDQVVEASDDKANDEAAGKQPAECSPTPAVG